MKLAYWLAPAISLLLIIAARADIIHLDDGSQVEGKLTKTSEGWRVVQNNGLVVDVKAEHVTSIEAKGTPNPNAAADRLASLRRVVEHLADVHQIIDRYDKFLAQNAGSPAEDDARADLATWHQRLDQGLVKVGDKWVTAAERDHRRDTAQTTANTARDLIRDGKLKDAQAVLTAALSDDPSNALALYLQGLVYYKQDQLTPARKAFESANESEPNDAATLNNLGVLCWRQKSYVAALNYYDLAMLARPVDKLILDNVAEALHALPAESKQAPVTLRAAKDFADQDAQLQQLAAREGKLRWGSGWVTQAQMDTLKAKEAEIKASVAQMSSQYDLMQQKLGEIDAEIDANTREMHRLAASLSYIDPVTGGVVQLPLPQAYYDLQTDNQKLATSKKPLQAQQANLSAQAKKLQAQTPAPPFTGIHEFIGLEGAPAPEYPDATTRAAIPSSANGGENANPATKP